MRKKLSRLALFLTFPMLTAAYASAATFTANTSSDSCASGTGGLQQCLDLAVDNGEDDVVNLVAGSYTNVPYTYNAAISAETGDLTLVGPASGQATIDGNDADQGMNLISFGLDDTNTIFTVQGLVFTGGNSGNGGGLQASTTNGSVVVEASEFNDNNGTLGAGADIQTSGAGPITVRNSTFSGNTAASAGGALHLNVEDGNVLLENNSFEGNNAEIFGGGAVDLTVEDSDSVVIANNLFFNNEGVGDGGGIQIELIDQDVDFALTNNTFFNNSADGNGGGLAVIMGETNALANIYNNIFFENSATGDGQDIYADEDSDGDMTFSAVALFNNLYADFFSVCQDGGGSCVTEGENVVGQDPLFVDAAGGDFHLSADSPAINAGDPNAPDMPDTDYDGNPRPDVPGTNPDSGAFEFQAPDPTPTPSPIPTPTPDLEGDGCSLGGGSSAFPVSALGMGLAVLSMAALRWRKRR